MSRRQFLKTTGGMAAALLAMNSVFGKFFDIGEIELFETAAFAERRETPYFHFRCADTLRQARIMIRPMPKTPSGRGVQAGAIVAPPASRTGLNPKLCGRPRHLDDLSWENFVKEVFLDSETTIGLISTPPGPYPQEAVVPPKEMAHIRDEINRLAQSQRMLAHGLRHAPTGGADLDFMAMQAATLKVDAWKGYTGSCPKGFDRGWWMDDEKIAYPMLEQARKLRVRRVCVHKGLPLGPVAGLQPSEGSDQGGKGFPGHRFPRLSLGAQECLHRGYGV